MFIDGKMYQNAGHLQRNIAKATTLFTPHFTKRDLSTVPIPQKSKEPDAGEKIHLYAYREDSWQSQTHNTSTTKNFNGNYFHHGDYFRSLSLSWLF